MGVPMKPRHCLFALLPLSLLLTVTLSSLSSARAAPALPSLRAALDHILEDPALRGGITGAVVVRVRDGRSLYAHNADIRLLPASNRKLFTAAAALGLLGDGYVYHTQVLAQAKPDSAGVVHGDVVLRGAGDGALTTADLDDLAAQMAKMGVKRIDGDVRGDASLFTDGPYGFGWEWDDLSDEEFPVISSLEVNDGDVHVHVAPGELGQPVVVTLTPPATYPGFSSQGRTAAAHAPNTCIVSRPYATESIHIGGDLPLGTTVDQNVPVANPPLYASRILYQCLQGQGIIHALTLGRVFAAGPTTVVLATHNSLPLTQYLPLMMKPSDNLDRRKPGAHGRSHERGRGHV